MHSLASAPGTGIWVDQMLVVKKVWWEEVQLSNEIIHRMWDIHLLVVTAAPLLCCSVQMCKKKKKLSAGTTSSLRVQGYLEMTALQWESWAHIKTDTMCCFNSLGPIKFHRPRSRTRTHSHNIKHSPWGSDSQRWKPPSVTHRSHNLSWHRRTALPMERCRFTHAECRPRLQTAIVLQSHPNKTMKRVTQGPLWNGK